MEEPSKSFAPELSPAQSKKWIGRLVVAVVLGVAIWNFVVTLTNAVIVPGLAQIMETDPQSPLYLGKGDFNIPAIFAAILELCLALMAALVVNSWAQRRPRVAQRKVTVAAPAKILSVATPAEPVVPPLMSAAAVAPKPEAPPPPAKPVQSEKPAAKKPKQVYYNSVGEPIDSDE